MRTGSKLPVLTAYFPTEMAYGILGKGGLFVTPVLEDCLTGITGISTDYSLSVAVWPTAKH